MVDEPDWMDEAWDGIREEEGRPRPGLAAVLFLLLAAPLIWIYAHSLGLAGHGLPSVPAILLRDLLALQPMALLIAALLASCLVTGVSWLRERAAQKRK